MRFWDASAVVAVCVEEPASKACRGLLREDQAMIAWWGTRIECISALVRRTREGVLDRTGEDQARAVLDELAGAWTEVQPARAVRDSAERLLSVHTLRAADSLQLAAALTWCRGRTRQAKLVTFDARLREAARKEGFTLLP